MAIRVVLVGTGGWGRTWCKNTLPGGRAKGLVDIVGAVDMNPDNLKNAEEFMGLSPEQCFADLAQGCTCPKSFPICVCGNKPLVKVITRKPILPDAEELEINPRARSAKLRVAERL